ncbi:MAG: iron chelate uptake ABC transporter family permease subunit [Micropruina sp.]|uniref:FecCD family ABC transporter permease n=1 Tax=Micropruina sp. TaxID=2737536 RepID=UPI0039E59CDC
MSGEPFSPAAHQRFRIGRLGGLSWPVYPRAVLIGVVMAVLLVALAAASLSIGRRLIPPAELWAALLHPDAGGTATIVWSLRLPRVICGICVGAALAVAGAVFQSISRNPLGSPEIIGLTSGAATGAVFAIVVLGGHGAAASAGALVGCLVASAATYLLAYRGRSIGGYRLVLVGIGVGAFLQAVTTLMLVRSDPDIAITGQLWLVGTLNARNWEDAAAMALVAAIGIPAVLAAARRLNALELGDPIARQLGLRVEGSRLLAVALGVALTGAAVATCGPISFVALAAPHIARRLARTATVPVLPSALLGALLLLVADLIGQNLPGGLTAPVGVTAGVIGGGYLLWILTRKRYQQ